MPIPFIAAGIVVASALTGVGSGVKAVKNTKEANRNNSEARSMINSAEFRLDGARQDTNESLEDLGKEKLYILSTSVRDFLRYFQLLKKVEFEDSTAGIEELKALGTSDNLLGELRTDSYEAVKIASGGMASLGAGVAAAYGAYAGTMALGTASTGAAISGLSGVAATNATLAWLGGGSLSAGGFGMAGGTMVLGGIVAGPALAVGGLIMSAQAKKKLENSYANLSEARVVANQMKSAQVVLESVRGRSRQVTELLTNINDVFVTGIDTMQEIITQNGTDWNAFDVEMKKSIHLTFLTAQLLKGIIDTPLLDEDGAITQKSAELLKLGKERLKEINEKM